MVLSTNIYLPNGFQRLQGKSPHPLLRCRKAVNWEALADFGNTGKIVLFLDFSRVQSAQSKAQWAFLSPLQQVLGNSSRLSPPTTNSEEFLGTYSFVPQDLWFLTTQSYVKSRPLNLVVVLHSEWNIMNSHNLLGTMTSIMTSARHGIVLGVAGRANTCAALFHSVIIVFCRGQSSWVLWSCCPFILFKTFPAHSVSQNRHCPTNSNPQFSPFMNEGCLACTKIIFNVGKSWFTWLDCWT